MEKKILLLLLIHIKEQIYNDGEPLEPQLLLLPFEKHQLKIEEIITHYLYTWGEVFPEHLAMVINHFQNMKNISSESSLVKNVWRLVEFAFFRFPSKESIDSILTTIFSLFEEVNRNF
jgi:hypothetical protein